MQAVDHVHPLWHSQTLSAKARESLVNCVYFSSFSTKYNMRQYIENEKIQINAKQKERTV